jgi:GH18 family chitinase
VGHTTRMIGISVLLIAGCSEIAPPASAPPPPDVTTTTTVPRITHRTPYYESLASASHADWMRWLPDDTSLSAVSIPGTHESLSIHGGDVPETQEDYGDGGGVLTAQLDAGIRAFDVRVRAQSIANNKFDSFHGSINQHAWFDEVLHALGQFLAAHPTETVLLRVKAECQNVWMWDDFDQQWIIDPNHEDALSCEDDEGTNNTDLENIFQHYRDNNPDAQTYFWAPSVMGEANMPTLGEVRGKIVLRSFNGRFGGPFSYGLAQVNVQDSNNNYIYVQDDYNVPTLAHIDDKWTKVRNQILAANADPGNMYINFTSGVSSGAYPYTVAGGTGVTKGVNQWTLDWLLEAHVDRTGVMMMDFPGAGLIGAIIAHNFRSAPWSSDVESDARDMLQNIVGEIGGDADARATQLETFLQGKVPQLHWNIAVVKQDYGYDIGTDPSHGLMTADSDGFRFFAYGSDEAAATQSEANIQQVVDPVLDGLSGDLTSRAQSLRALLQQSYPNTTWAVIVKLAPGGFENWSVHHYGSTYQTWRGDHGYLIYGIANSVDDAINALDWNVSLPDAGTPRERVAYFTSWSIYANGLTLKNLDTNRTASKLTVLNYAFENIHPVDLTCFAANHASSGDESSSDGNDGASDAWADYQKGFTAEESVDGVADSWGDHLKGNFNQLKKLKAKYPNLKTVVTIGGWTFSKYFSDVAATDASRSRFVSSCIDMYIRGNLPQIGDDPAGGTGVAAGVFDGIDIDWEFPGSSEGHTGNHYGPQDVANFTLLVAEFRRQLDALGGGHYLLTAALPSGPGNVAQIEPQISQYLDLAHIMTYDMHGAWETSGPANLQAPTFASPLDPSPPGLTVDNAISAYIARGVPANKITMGVPFYARGWQGVPDNGRHGLYQPTGPGTDPYPFSQQAGVAFYKELLADGKLTNATVYWDPTVKGTWIYDGNNFFTVETPKSLSAKRQYIQDRGLAGVMMYSLEADEPSTTPLLNAATNFQ